MTEHCFLLFLTASQLVINNNLWSYVQTDIADILSDQTSNGIYYGNLAKSLKQGEQSEYYNFVEESCKRQIRTTD